MREYKIKPVLFLYDVGFLAATKKATKNIIQMLCRIIRVFKGMSNVNFEL